MRRVEICRKGHYGGIDKNEPSSLCIGTFHGFYSEGNIEDGIECYGLIELPGGSLRMQQTHKMRFVDNIRPEED